MKKIMIALILALSLLFSGCTALIEQAFLNAEFEQQTFHLFSYGIEFTADSSFSYKTASGDWDLQLSNGHAYFNVMAFYKSDLEGDLTPADIYAWQNEDIFSRRENVTVLRDQTTKDLEGKTVTFTRFSAVNEGNENYYDSYLVDFTEENIFAWVLISGLPTTLEKKGDDYGAYVESFSLMEKE